MTLIDRIRAWVRQLWAWLSTLLSPRRRIEPPAPRSLRPPDAPPSTRDQISERRPGAEGRRTQGAEIERPITRQPTKPQVTDVVLGLDFGTSCTKVVIRTPILGGGRAVPVPFEARSRFLLPTSLLLEPTGRVSLGVRAAQGWSSLKARLMDAPGDATTGAEAAAFLGLVIRHSVGWFRRTEAASLRGRELRWQLNLGIPSPGYDDEPIRSGFERVARAAWAFAHAAGAPSLDLARTLLDQGKQDNARIGVVPEVIAEVIGYARSPSRQQDLHLLVDVGASTLDICGFILFDPNREEDQYALLTTRIDRLGTHELHLARLRAIGIESCRPEIRALELADPLLAIPDSIHSYPKDEPIDARVCEAIDQRFESQCVDAVMQSLHRLKTTRYSGSPSWQRGLPVFLCGGGAEMRFYRNVLEKANARALAAWHMSPITFPSLPLPDSMARAGVSDDLFRRLAVAYGLSFDRLEIGRILPPSAVPDAPASQGRREREFIGKEQV